ncbi:restriction endonuclease subunit S [Erysipelothrix rhusiopathiae]|nr:restriction endonuclease subunit S [Erysipelothrix rhusiopathiae]MDE9419825.1 restriction endonuclease subunit S [Erysipelothrix rhusiopathiae]
MKNKPDIRFDGFDEDWEQHKLENVANFFNQKRVPIDSELRSEGIYPYYGATGIIDYVENYIFDGEYVLLAEDGANITTRNSPIAYITKGKFWLNNHAHIMSMINGNNQFLLQILEKQNFTPMNTGTAQPKLNFQTVRKMQLIIPQEDEQQKIGTFFQNLDHLITLHQRELENYKLLKKGFLQKLFPSNGDTNPSIRFDGFNDAWEQCNLGEVSDKVTKKNSKNEFIETFTNSAEHGIINQRDFFDKDISNEKNLNGYYVVNENDFVYNPRISNFAPVGPIKRNKLGRTGVMSPLYYVFKTKNVNKTYLEYYFDTTIWHKFMKLNGDSGARSDRFAIKDSVFKEMPIPYPSEGEQHQIGIFFQSLDNLITLHQRELDNYKELKKGFLQKMFV